MGKIQLPAIIHVVAVLVSAIVITIPATVVVAVPLGRLVTPEFFNNIRNKAGSNCKGKHFYTRRAFLKAAKSYPRFGHLDSVEESKREIAAFFAHVSHETGESDPTYLILLLVVSDLCYTEEIERGTYCDSSAVANPCAPGRQYYGRGPLQLSWNYNYGECGKANGFDGLRNPDIVARDPVVTWKSALWFWSTSVRPTERKGFGETIHKINGMECNHGNTDEVEDRVRYYREYCKQLGVSPGNNIRC
ncbi:unnamed protein product [Linum tenue]|uniref:chitinase n=1 Tax=Linum tenue TaxID=586396 RepID=A0AAV0PMG0_9ROSI|nr:unnamed protein product [Linum tenue]